MGGILNIKLYPDVAVIYYSWVQCAGATLWRCGDACCAKSQSTLALHAGIYGIVLLDITGVLVQNGSIVYFIKREEKRQL